MYRLQVEKKGSLTVETTLIMPIVLMVIIVMFFLVLYVYNQEFWKMRLVAEQSKFFTMKTKAIKRLRENALRLLWQIWRVIWSEWRNRK